MEDILKQLGITEEELRGSPSKQAQTPSAPTTFLIKNAIFLTPVAITSLLMGFFGTLAMAKRKDTEAFQKGLLSASAGQESGGSLAMRALGRGSLWAVGGTALIAATVYAAYPKLIDEQKSKSKSE